MKRIDFTVTGEPRIGATIEIEGIVSHDEPMPRLVPLRYNDTPISMPVRNAKIRIEVQFHTRGRVTVAPVEGWEGNTLVLDATEPL